MALNVLDTEQKQHTTLACTFVPLPVLPAPRAGFKYCLAKMSQSKKVACQDTCGLKEKLKITSTLEKSQQLLLKLFPFFQGAIFIHCSENMVFDIVHSALGATTARLAGHAAPHRKT